MRRVRGQGFAARGPGSGARVPGPKVPGPTRRPQDPPCGFPAKCRSTVALGQVTWRFGAWPASRRVVGAHPQARKPVGAMPVSRSSARGPDPMLTQRDNWQESVARADGTRPFGRTGWADGMRGRSVGARSGRGRTTGCGPLPLGRTPMPDAGERAGGMRPYGQVGCGRVSRALPRQPAVAGRPRRRGRLDRGRETSGGGTPDRGSRASARGGRTPSRRGSGG